MFEIIEDSFGKFKQIILKNTNTSEYVSIIPDFGATINQIALLKNNQLHKVISGCNSYEELITEGKNKFKGCKLFPYPNRIENGTYTFEGKQYQFPINFPTENNSIHGLLCDARFEIVNKIENFEQALLSIEYNTIGDEQGYPFKAKINIEFILNKEGFTCITYIKNQDTKNIPVADGWHPYFTLGIPVDKCEVTIPAEFEFEVNDRMLPTGKKNNKEYFNKPFEIGTHFFDNGYKVKQDKKVAETIIQNKQNDLSLVFWQETGKNKYNYLQLYIPPDRSAIAIEPMTSPCNAFNTKDGLIILNPNENIDLLFGVKIR